MRQSQCPTCGAAVSLPEEVVADRCVFCESPLVAALDEGPPADAVAPFLLDRTAASEKLRRWLQGRWLAPRDVRESRGPEELRGVLVPFWAHDAEARSRWSARIGIYWYRTETYTVTVVRDGKQVTETRTRQVRETEWFPTSGTHAASYQDHLVSGSRGLSEEEANALEPFDVGGAMAFAPELLAGWVAERPTIPRDEAERVAEAELRGVEERAIAAFLPGDVGRGLQAESAIGVHAVRLVLLPVWIGTYRFHGEVHRLLVNGQTGEVVGTVPQAWGRIVLLVVGVGFLLLFVVGLLVAIGEAVS